MVTKIIAADKQIEDPNPTTYQLETNESLKDPL